MPMSARLQRARKKLADVRVRAPVRDPSHSLHET